MGLDMEKVRAVFEAEIKEKVRFVCTKKCWASNIRHYLNTVLKSGKELGVYGGKLISEALDKKLQALHNLGMYAEIKAFIVEATGLAELLEDVPVETKAAEEDDAA